MKSKYPTGTKFRGKNRDGYYLRIEDGYEYINNDGSKDETLCAYDDEFPEWETDGTWEKFYDIEYPKEELFDNLYERMV